MLRKSLFYTLPMKMLFGKYQNFRTCVSVYNSVDIWQMSPVRIFHLRFEVIQHVNLIKQKKKGASYFIKY
jgi:hypothetical protein